MGRRLRPFQTALCLLQPHLQRRNLCMHRVNHPIILGHLFLQPILTPKLHKHMLLLLFVLLFHPFELLFPKTIITITFFISWRFSPWGACFIRLVGRCSRRCVRSICVGLTVTKRRSRFRLGACRWCFWISVRWACFCMIGWRCLILIVLEMRTWLCPGLTRLSNYYWPQASRSRSPY